MFDKKDLSDEVFQRTLMANAVRVYEHIRLNPNCSLIDATDIQTASMLRDAGLLWDDLENVPQVRVAWRVFITSLPLLMPASPKKEISLCHLLKRNTECGLNNSNDYVTEWLSEVTCRKCIEVKQGRG